MLRFPPKAYQEDKPRTRTAIAFVTVNVIDVDDNLPYFPSSVLNATVREHSAVSTTVVRLQAVDEDSVSYSYILLELHDLDSQNKNWKWIFIEN